MVPASLCAHGSVRYAAWLGGKQSGKTGCEPAAQRERERVRAGGRGRGRTGAASTLWIRRCCRFFLSPPPLSFFLPALFALQRSSRQTCLVNPGPRPLTTKTATPIPNPPAAPPGRFPLSGCRNYPPRFMFLPPLDFHALPDLCFPGPGQEGKHSVASLTFQPARSRCDSLSSPCERRKNKKVLQRVLFFLSVCACGICNCSEGVKQASHGDGGSPAFFLVLFS